MRHSKTRASIFSMALAGVAPLVAFYGNIDSSQIVAGAGSLAFLMTSRYFRKAKLRESAPKKLKTIGETLAVIGFPFIAGGLLFVPVVPTWLGVATLLVSTTALIFREKVVRGFSRSYSFELGTDYWIAGLGAIYLASAFNPFFQYYGLMLVNALVVYDLIKLASEVSELNRV